MAGPLEALSIRNWIMDLSETIPDIPPRASISRTIWPFATPPMAGLQDICPMVAMFMVTSITRDPMVAAAHAASQPAWPPPTTITSYSGNIYFTQELSTNSSTIPHPLKEMLGIPSGFHVERTTNLTGVGSTWNSGLKHSISFRGAKIDKHLLFSSWPSFSLAWCRYTRSGGVFRVPAPGEVPD